MTTILQRDDAITLREQAKLCLLRRGPPVVRSLGQSRELSGMTLSLLALWFVSLERSRMRGEKGSGEQLPGKADVHATAASAAAEGRTDRYGDQRCLAA